MGTKNAHRSLCYGWSSGAAVIMVLTFLLCSHVWAGPIEAHNKEYKELAGKILAYEKRVEDLVAQKANTKEGPDLENILNDISDLQKELVGIKKKRRELRDHVTTTHPKNEILDDLSILKDAESAKGKTSSNDPALDKKLDDMLKRLRAQYKRSAKEDDSDEYVMDQEEVIEAELTKKKKNVHKAAKDEYIRENIKTKLKVK